MQRKLAAILAADVVLPFQNLSADPDAEFIAGLRELGVPEK